MSDIDASPAPTPAPAEAKGTQRWVKITWIAGLVSIALGVILSFTSVTIEPGESAPELSCGTMWSPDDSGAVEWAKGWEDARILSVHKLGIDLPDMQTAVSNDCANAIDGQKQGAGGLIAFGFLLGIVGLVGRMRPNVGYRVVRT